jgi:ferric-dicitrate binding protein FerR (iron transport regulator)
MGTIRNNQRPEGRPVNADTLPANDVADQAAGWLGWRQWGAELAADHRTATGQRSDHRLADGSLLHLNTASAADVRFDAAQRRIVLQAGEILIHTAPDSVRPPRPFVVQTEHGTIRALGTRFVVQRESGRQTRVSVLEHAVEIRPALGNAALRLDAGQSVRFSAHAAGPIQPAPPRPAATPGARATSSPTSSAWKTSSPSFRAIAPASCAARPKWPTCASPVFSSSMTPTASSPSCRKTCPSACAGTRATG